MSFQIEIRSGEKFTCEASETILEAALKADIHLPHSCKNGRCESCIVAFSGCTEAIKPEYLASKEAIPTCTRAPRSDGYLDVDNLVELRKFRIKKLPAKISVIRKLTEDVILVRLRIPPASSLEYLAGQYVNISKGSVSRSYSISNARRADESLDFIIRRCSGGAMSEYWFKEAIVNDLVFIEGPLGSFYMRENSVNKHLVFLATGTGIAPIRAMLEQMRNDELDVANRAIHIIWGNRYLKDFFELDCDLNWVKNFTQTCSRETSAGYLSGYVQQVMLDTGLPLDKCTVYACGSPVMIEDARRTLQQSGLCSTQFYSDSFVASGEHI